MSKDKILQWYKIQGLEDVIGKNKRNLATDPQEKINVESMFKEEQKEGVRSVLENCNNIDDLQKLVSSFDECLLKKTATNTVFADGCRKADVMLVGEAPGANEDIKGIPFCGESGKLLDKILASVGLYREKNIYITNSVFWRPPGNRKPTEQEIELCLPFLEKHIALVKPKVIVAVGAISLYALFKYVGSISKRREQFFEYHNRYLESPIKAMTIFHPAYLLRQPSQKRTAWEDMLMLKNALKEIKVEENC